MSAREADCSPDYGPVAQGEQPGDALTINRYRAEPTDSDGRRPTGMGDLGNDDETTMLAITRVGIRARKPVDVLRAWHAARGYRDAQRGRPRRRV
jgi:hypothetical protein